MKCEKCPREFDKYAKEPTRVGYGEQVNNNWLNYRKNFDLCEDHLIEKIREDIASASKKEE